MSGGGALGLAHIGVLRVLQEHGVPVDIVSGNSMGAVVGALFAIGYTPDEIEDAVSGTDWMDLFKEKPDRTTIPVYKRDSEERYQVRFTVQGKKVDFLPGIKSGQSIHMLFSRLAWPAHLINDFSDFPRPFRCLATDIETGEAVVLDRGFLPDAMRASMSIPGVFTPFRMNGRLLVDGFLSRDFPVEDLREMGADIIIGVNTGLRPLSADSIDTMIEIITQSVLLTLRPALEREGSLCDILIAPDLEKFTVIDFMKTSEIIRAGEDAARKISARLDELADSMSRWEYDPPRMKGTSDYPLEITEISIIGEEMISEEAIKSTLGIEPPAIVDASILDRATRRLFGTGAFEYVRYRLKRTAGGISLLYYLKEDKRDFLNIGLYYDTISRHSLLIALDIHDPLTKGSELDLDIMIGSRLRVGSMLSFRKGFKNILHFNLGTDYIHDRIDIYDRSNLVSRLKADDIRASAGTGLSLSRYISSTASIVSEWSRISPDIAPPGSNVEWDKLIFLDSGIYFDNLDRTWFPRSGIMMRLDAQIAGSWLENGRSFNRVSGRLSFRIPLRDRIVLGGRCNIGSARGDRLPLQYQYFAGGAWAPFTFHSPGEMNLYGYHRYELSGRHAVVAGLELQFQPMRYLYLVMHGNAGNAVDRWNELLVKDDLYFGSAVTLGFDSPIGPLEASVANSSRHDVIIFFSGGYRF
ncbi:MAG: patatin-like phospholipase family protein [Candidatus Krumholzibacteriota bacterium]|nr:patatin-like phospholipase family protein [Candidatus Krumholzibacteriota bacterium]